MTAPVDNYLEQGKEFLDEGQYTAAIDLFTKALRLSLGDLAEVLLYRGICYAYIETFEQSMADFNEALRQNPYYADAYNERGNLLRLQGAYEQALSDYDAAITIDSAHYAAYYNRALTYEQLGAYPEAEQDLTQTIELNPGIAPAYEVRGRIRAILENYDDAIVDLSRYLRMGGGHEFDNHSEIQSFILALRMRKLFGRFIPKRFLPGNRI